MTCIATHSVSRPRRPRFDAHPRGGFSLIEMMVVLSILAIAGAMFAQTLASSKRLDPTATETAIAAEGARSFLETMHNHAFGEVFALYNDNPLDDPGGPGSAPGSAFDVEGLVPQVPGASVGHVIFPAVESELREDAVEIELGTPRDLNGDGAVDDADHSNDWLILPVKVQLDWQSGSGTANKRRFTIYGMFSRL